MKSFSPVYFCFSDLYFTDFLYPVFIPYADIDQSKQHGAFGGQIIELAFCPERNGDIYRNGIA